MCDVLSEGQADLWVAAVPRAPLADVLPRVERLLSGEEVASAHRFVFERHQVLYAVSHAFLRSVLSQYLERAPREIQLVRDSRGRPELEDRALRFNLSHTEGLALVGVTAAADIGVDVEDTGRRLPDAALVQSVFTPDEIRDWNGSAGSFFARWTLKEAYLKARGFGLALDLQRFSFREGHPSLSCSPEFDDPAAWQFHAFIPEPGFCAAAAMRRESGAPVDWRVHVVDPFSLVSTRS